MNDLRKKHTFVICAYKESPFLEECILSLKNQSSLSNIIMITSTPNDYIRSLAKKYEITLSINEGDCGIVQDWNYGYKQCVTPYVTIVHQDDIYFKNYALRAVKSMDRSKKPLIYFSNYCKIRNGEKIYYNRLLRIKRKLLFPLKIGILKSCKIVRRISLSFGNCICCPSVTFAVNNLPNPVFNVHFRSNEDWEAWERISKISGEFIYDDNVQMGHRIHAGSETSIIIGDHARSKEDYEMFCKFWPRPIAKIIIKFYSESERSNDLNK